jgi:hypothetical protein
MCLLRVCRPFLRTRMAADCRNLLSLAFQATMVLLKGKGLGSCGSNDRH